MMYLRMCLAKDAGVTPDLSSLEAMKAQAPQMSGYIRDLNSAETDRTGPVSVYANFTNQLVSAFPGQWRIKFILSMYIYRYMLLKFQI